MSTVKLLVGKTLDSMMHKLINQSPGFLKFIPVGRYLSLDLKRANAEMLTIFDVGANIGQTSVMLQKAFPRAAIHSFEPVLSTYRKLEEVAKHYRQIHPVNLALGETAKSVRIITKEDSELNSLKDNLTEPLENTEVVQVQTGLHYCLSANVIKINLLKIDTEGYELNVLNGFGPDFLSNNVDFIYIEVGFDEEDELKTHYSKVEGCLSQQGFVTSGFYEPYRWGKSKLRLGFCNVLFTNSRIL